MKPKAVLIIAVLLVSMAALVAPLPKAFAASPTLVQSNTSSGTGTSSYTCALSSTVTAGDGLFLLLSVSMRTGITASDSLANTWVLQSEADTTGQTRSGNAYIFSAYAAIGGASDTITFTGIGGYIQAAWCGEISNVEVTSDFTSTGTSTWSSSASYTNTVTSFTPASTDVVLEVESELFCNTLSSDSIASGFTKTAQPSAVHPSTTCNGGNTFGLSILAGYSLNWGGGATTVSQSVTSGTAESATTAGIAQAAASFLVAASVNEQVTISPTSGSGTATIVNCGPSVGTIAMDSSQHSFTAAGGCPISFQVPSDSLTSRFRFAKDSGTWSYNTAATGTDTKSQTVYSQLSFGEGYSATGGGTFTNPSFTHTDAGATMSNATAGVVAVTGNGASNNDGYVNVPDAASLDSTTFTLNVWLYPTTQPAGNGYNKILSKGSPSTAFTGFDLEYCGATDCNTGPTQTEVQAVFGIGATFCGTGASAATLVTLNTWTMITFEWNQGSSPPAQFLVNGLNQFDGGVCSGDSMSTSSSPLQIGCNTVVSCADGMDFGSVQYWNSYLSITQIQALYANPYSMPATSNLKLALNFNAKPFSGGTGTGAVFNDLSGNSNSGTLIANGGTVSWAADPASSGPGSLFQLGALWWADSGTSWSLTNPLTISSSERMFTPTTVSGTVSAATTARPNYYHQYLVPLSYSVSGPGASFFATAPTLTCLANGISTTVTLSTSATSTWLDAGCQYSVPDPISGGGGRTATVPAIVPSVVQTAFCNTHSGQATSLTCALGSNVASGDMLFLAVAGSDGSLQRPTDTLGTFYFLLGCESGLGDDMGPQACFYFGTAPSSSADTVTAAGSAANSYDILVMDIQGYTATGASTAVGQAATGDSFSTSPLSWNGKQLLVALASLRDSIGTTTCTAGFSYCSGNGNHGVAEYTITGISSPTSFPMSGTGVPSAWDELGVAIQSLQGQNLAGGTVTSAGALAFNYQQVLSSICPAVANSSDSVSLTGTVLPVVIAAGLIMAGLFGSLAFAGGGGRLDGGMMLVGVVAVGLVVIVSVVMFIIGASVSNNVAPLMNGGGC